VDKGKAPWYVQTSTVSTCNDTNSELSSIKPTDSKLKESIDNYNRSIEKANDILELLNTLKENTHRGASTLSQPKLLKWSLVQVIIRKQTASNGFN